MRRIAMALFVFGAVSLSSVHYHVIGDFSGTAKVLNDPMKTRTRRLAGASVLLSAGILAFAQGPLAQIGVSEPEAREWLQKMVEDGAPSVTTTEGDNIHEMIVRFRSLPASAKGPLTTQLYAWAKGVLMTPAFKARYLKTREARRLKPEDYAHPLTVEQELRERVEKETAEQEERWKQAEASGIKEVRDAVALQRRQWPEIRDQAVAGWKADIEQKRAYDKEQYETGTADWMKLYPADPIEVIARSLHEFLDTTGDVDFAAKKGPVLNGSEYNFLNSAYWNKPWQWQMSWEWGPEAIGAARTAASAWLKELGK